MRFSILIPVYNVEKYLEKCVDSVLSQSFTDFEVILVNDGSKDSSPEICEGLAAKDSRIKYYSKANEGLLLTRRYSIRHASGEYVLFLDSDDYWRPGILEFLDKAISRTNADIVTYRFCRIRDDETLVYNDIDVFHSEKYFTEDSKEEFIREFVSSSRLNTMWTKCVRLGIIDVDADYSGFKDKKGEDLLQSIVLLRNAKTILYTNEILVNYRLSPNGRGRNFKLSYLTDYEAVRQHVCDKLTEMNVSDATMKAFYRRYLSGLLGYIGSLANKCENSTEFAAECAKLKSYSLYEKASAVLSAAEIPAEVQKEYHAIASNHTIVLYYRKRLMAMLKRMLKRH